jgi:hypothetical protein
VVVTLLLTGTGVSMYFAVQASVSARQAQAALQEAQVTREREQQTALRFIRFVKKNPASIKLPSELLLARFLEENRDLSETDVIDAFMPAAEAGINAPPSFAPSMFGD